ncbi:MAG: UDP-N-acetylmuramate dehydrogenase [Phycisphaerae bacterium]|nr:MAG: UDP-N-acetylmuramate dehydrogenase [Planctomycetota bacterium]MBE7455281.1 UDP-N-acetylmuramate dehydrogenase [Planctomycetia bacterium]MCL4717733.1 UDP-N-acetylmuramate dehydrogenase [Phycisphaerae bacterium]
MSWWRGWRDRIETDAPLGARTWYRIGGRAKWLAHPSDAESLSRLMSAVAAEGVPRRVLGRGANVLVRDEGFDGVVIVLDAPAFTKMTFEDVSVCVGGGADLMKLCKACCDRGLSGLEGLAAIPASVGGAVRMNAGGRYGEFGDRVRSISVVETGGALRDLSREDVGFGYRTWGLGRAIVTEVVMDLVRDDPVRVRGRFKEYWRLKRATQPVGERSAGCVFKNPPGASAGRMIDEAGLKGERCGGAQVSPRHANFIVASADARASDVLALAQRVRDRVRERFGVELEQEMEVW